MLAQSQRLEGAGRNREALNLGREIVKAQPGWSMGHFAIGSALCNLGLLDEADAALKKAIARDATQASFFMRRAEVLNRMGRHEQAVETIDRGVALAPDNPRVLIVKAMVLWLGGDPRAGRACLGELIERGVDDQRMRMVHALIAGEIGEIDEGIAALETLRSEQAPRLLRSEVLLTLAKLYDKAGRYDEAFAAADEGGRLRETGYVPQETSRRCADRLAAWSPERFAQTAEARFTTEAPVFIIGMPRSGTSLVEQIIASHPLAFGGGERLETWHAALELTEPTELEPDRARLVAQLKPAALDRHARSIVKSLEKAAKHEMGEGAKRLTDKLPSNYEHVGLIRKLFPRAKIVHCVRDARDTCLSCFLLDFVGDHNHGYSYNLAHLAAQYLVYQRYMAHWRDALGIEILDVRYEQLIEDLEVGARRIIEFVGLDWDDACARPHQTKRAVSTHSSSQVRRPVYTSSMQRWRRYEKHLGPLLEGLDL